MERMHQLIRDLPSQIENALELEIPLLDARGINHLVFAGMGGSAISADILRSYLSDLPLPMEVVRSYALPAYVSSGTLVIATSYSGNTEEVLSAFREALERGARAVAITSGGKLQKEAAIAGAPVVLVPSGLPPRAALGWLFTPLVLLLSRAGLIADKTKELASAARFLRNLIEGMEAQDGLARELAEKFYMRLPLIYASERLFPVARRWKTQINENANAFAHIDCLPELDHNEIMGIDQPRLRVEPCWAVFLLDEEDHPRIQLRARETAELIRNSVMGVTYVRSQGESWLERLFYLLYLGDYISLYLAQAYGVDPVAIPRIDELKRRLAQ